MPEFECWCNSVPLFCVPIRINLQSSLTSTFKMLESKEMNTQKDEQETGHGAGVCTEISTERAQPSPNAESSRGTSKVLKGWPKIHRMKPNTIYLPTTGTLRDPNEQNQAHDGVIKDDVGDWNPHAGRGYFVMKRCWSFLACFVGLSCLLAAVIVVVIVVQATMADADSPTQNKTDECPKSCKLSGLGDVIEPLIPDKEKDEEQFDGCCGDDCFNRGYPFNEQPLPHCINRAKLTYTLFRDDKTALLYHDKDVPQLLIPEYDTVLVTHGYLSAGSVAWIKELRKALHKAKPHLNIIVLDWQYYAKDAAYSQAAANTRSVGAFTARLINQMAAKESLAFSRFWCIGHSLGSHLCGFIGSKTSKKISRITALDPAGPCFECKSSVEVGLNKKSADVVEVIHTDTAGGKIINRFGTKRPIGDIDFYVNGIGKQPGCLTRRKRKVEIELDVNFTDDDVFTHRVQSRNSTENITCSHSRAYEILTEAIVYPDTCTAPYKCDDISNMPDACHRNCAKDVCAAIGLTLSPSHGIFFLQTKDESPYCGGND